MTHPFRPTTRTIYLWGLASVFCLVLTVIPSIITVTASIEQTYLLGTVVVFGITLVLSLCGLLFNRLYADGGVWSVALLTAAFFGLFLAMLLA